jgi:suppressor of G2 allele of SKP1
MIEAQYRRSVLYYKLQRYADSDCCARWSMLLAEGRPVREDDGVAQQVDANGNYTVTYEEGVADRAGQPNQPDSKGASIMGLLGGGAAGGTAKTGFEDDWKRAYTWRSQVLGIMNTIPNDHPGRKINVTKVPARPKEKVEKKPDPISEPDSEDDKEQAAKPQAPAPGSVPDEQLKLRVDFYQNAQSVTVSLFGKDIKKEDLKVEFSKDQVSLSRTHPFCPGWV